MPLGHREPAPGALLAVGDGLAHLLDGHRVAVLDARAAIKVAVRGDDLVGGKVRERLERVDVLGEAAAQQLSGGGGSAELVERLEAVEDEATALRHRLAAQEEEAMRQESVLYSLAATVGWWWLPLLLAPVTYAALSGFGARLQTAGAPPLPELWAAAASERCRVSQPSAAAARAGGEGGPRVGERFGRRRSWRDHAPLLRYRDGGRGDDRIILCAHHVYECAALGGAAAAAVGWLVRLTSRRGLTMC